MHQVYDDETTFKLVGAASQVSGLPMEVCLEEFGRHFLVYCQKNGYDQILRVLGSNLYDFLTNLDNLHDHLASIYPGMRAPSFRVTRQLESAATAAATDTQRDADATSDNAAMGASMYLHYYSERNGLSPIVKGLVLAVAREFFSTEIVVTECKLLKPQLNHADDHVVLKIDRRSQGDILFDAQTAANIEVAAAAQQQQAVDSTATSTGSAQQTGKGGGGTPTQKTMLSAMYGDSLSKCAGDSLINSEIMMQSFPFHVIFDQHFNLVQVGKSLLRVTSAFWRRRRATKRKPEVGAPPVKFSDLFSIVRPKIEFTFDAIADHTNQVFVVKTRPLVLNADFRRHRRARAGLPPPPPALSSHGQVELPPMCPMSRHALKRRSCVAKLASDPPDTPTPEVPPSGRGGQHNNDEPSEPPNHLSVRLKGQMIILAGGESSPLCLYLCSPRVDHLDQLLECGLMMSDLALHDRARELMLMSHTHKEDREAVKKLDQATNDLKKMDTKLRQENKRTNEVLHNIFPAKIATLLSHGTKVESESFDPVTCLYSDIIGFTKMCGSENVRPIDIVRLLNTLYLQFDNLTNIHGVYKVETIGDAYVIVGGLPEPVEDHADRCVKMGLDMVKVIATVRSPADNQPIQMRIGIHSGPVMAGIVGIRVPRYSLFGNTTTLANQLETHGVGGKIHISDFTLRNLIKRDRFVIEDNPNQLSGFPYKTYFVTNYLSEKGELQKHERILEEQLIKDFEMMGNEVELVEDSSRRAGQVQMSPKLVQRQAKDLRQQSQPTGACKAAPSDNNNNQNANTDSKRPLVVMDVEVAAGNTKKKVSEDKQLSEVVEISTLLSDKLIAEALEQAGQLDKLDRMLVALLLAGSQQLTNFYPAFERTKTAECIARAAKSLCDTKSKRDCPLCDGSGQIRSLAIEQLLGSVVNRKSQLPEVVEQSSRLQELLVGLGAERARLELQVARLERLHEEEKSAKEATQQLAAVASSANLIIKPERTLSSNMQRMKRMDTLKRRKMKRVDEPEKVKLTTNDSKLIVDSIEDNKRVTQRSTISQLVEDENESSDGADSMNVQQFIKSDSIEGRAKSSSGQLMDNSTAAAAADTKQINVDQSKSPYQMLRASIANIISDSAAAVQQLDDSGEDSTTRKKRFSLSNFGSSLSAAIVSPFSSPRKTSINTTTTTCHSQQQKEVRLQAASKNHDSRPGTANSANAKLGARDNHHHRRDNFRSNSNCSCLKSSGSSQSICSVER